uniref:LTP (Lipid transfer protein) n=1 Tax=Coffea canephora TaxID=49390 RepID=S6EV26_COFCA|nr:LTP (lipid transfer protein) [Coffea canephora]
MKKSSGVALCWCLVALLLVGLGQIQEAEAAGCNAQALSPCLPSIINGTPPSKQCCTNAKEQEPCFCNFIKDPAYGKIIKNPNTKKTLEACGLKWPTCP